MRSVRSNSRPQQDSTQTFLLGIRHETHLPAVQNPPRPHPRFPRPHENTRGPRRHQRPPRQRPQAPGGLTPARCWVSNPVQNVLRLQTRAQFQATMAGGTVARTAHFALHRLESVSCITPPTPSKPPTPIRPGPALPQNALGQPGPLGLFGVRGLDALWLGALVPKRWARRAVTRSTIKRQIYVVSAGFATQLPRGAHVVRLRAEFNRKHFVSATSDALKHAVRAELLVLFERALAAPPPSLPRSEPQP